jgi:glycosyltransferase involved in cell wall biosynthesis
MGFVPPSAEYVAQLTPYFEHAFPYVLYVGRKETMKNVPLLIDYFCIGKDKGTIPAELKLVIAGAGSFSDLHRPQALLRSDVIDLDHVSECEKQRLMKHSLCVCQPSTNESFSIVLMEAWMVGAPVLVHARCLVTREHVVASCGGLFFGDEHDCAAVLSALLRQANLRQRLAHAGLQYVQTRYAWSSVLQRFDTALAQIFSESTQGEDAATTRE